MRTFTVYVLFPSGGVEEIDVQARSREAARAQAKKELAADYNPGGKIVDVQERAAGWSWGTF